MHLPATLARLCREGVATHLTKTTITLDPAIRQAERTAQKVTCTYQSASATLCLSDMLLPRLPNTMT